MHGTSSANVVVPVKAGTTVATRAQASPWVDGAQLAGGPNSSVSRARVAAS